METRRLDLFVRIVEAGSVSRAARELGVAQPALSQQLAVLERELGASLLQRSAAGVTLTPAGQSLYARAQTILRLVADLRDTARSRAGEVAGAAPVGILPTLASRLGEKLFLRLTAEAPLVQLQLMEAGEAALLRALSDGSLDIVVISHRPRDRDVRAERLGAERLYVVASSAFPHPGDLSLADLAALPWIVTRPTNSIRQIVDATLAREGLAANVMAEIDSLTIVLAAVTRGMGITVLPEGAVPADGGLRAAPFADAWRTLSVCWREPLAPSSARALRTLRELAAVLAPGGDG